MKISKYLGITTPSEDKVIKHAMDNSLWKVLHITRSTGGYLIISIEKIGVRKTKKHVPPFKYQNRVYNKWGKLKFYKTGNIWDCDDIIDDFTEIGRR